MMKLQVRFWQIDGNCLVMKVLQQDESLRGQKLLVETADFGIRSASHPAITKQALFIRGDHPDEDDKIASITFDTAAEATKAREAWTRLIDQINGKVATHTALVDGVMVFTVPENE